MPRCGPWRIGQSLEPANDDKTHVTESAINPGIAINSLCFADPDLGTAIDTVARIGAQAITPDLVPVLELGAAKAAARIRDSGLTAAGLTHRAFAFANEGLAAQARERLNRTIEVAARIGAPTIIMTTGGRGELDWGESVTRFADVVTPCLAQAQAAGIQLAIEPTSHLYADVSIVHRLSDTVKVAQAAGIAVVIDLFAFWFDSDIDAAIAAATPNAAIVQVSDYVYGDRALPCRAVPGDGAIPLDRLLPAIVSAGFAGTFDLEIIGPRLQSEGVENGLTRAANAIGGILTQAGLK